jgi:flagellar biosynthesis protein FlhG
MIGGSFHPRRLSGFFPLSAFDEYTIKEAYRDTPETHDTMIINENNKRKIIPVASGKGGVGKSVLASNLAIMLANHGKRTIAIDLDLGGSNLHTYLGIKNTHAGIGNFLSSKEVQFDDLLVATPYKNLRFIPGDVLVSGIANLQHAQKRAISNAILKLEADYVILDLGSGTNYSVIDFFLVANSGFVVTTPETPAILNAYGFVKNIVFRYLQRGLTKQKRAAAYIDGIIRDRTPNSTPPVSKVLDELDKIGKKAGEEARTLVKTIKPLLLINKAKNPQDLGIGDRLRQLIRRNLNVDVESIGLVYEDRYIDRAVRAGLPVVVAEEDSIAAREIERIALKMIQSERFPIMPLETDMYPDSFALTQIEAESDYVELEQVEEPGTAPAAQPDDVREFLQVIGEQQKKIQELQGTIRMLTMKKGR